MAKPADARPAGARPADARLVDAKVPQRARGRARVAALLEAAAAVFAEKGYQAATMTEIAARATAPIGSLYQFFPSKDVLADALLARYGELLAGQLHGIEEQAAGMATADLAACLVDLLVGLQQERNVAIALIDARPDLSDRPAQMRRALLADIAHILRVHRSALAAEQAQSMALALLHLMKAATVLGNAADHDAKRAIPELHKMARLYLADGLDDGIGDRHVDRRGDAAAGTAPSSPRRKASAKTAARRPAR